MSFSNVTVFGYESSHLNFNFDSNDVGRVVHAISDAIDPDASIASNATNIKHAIDANILKPLIDSFTDPDVSKHLRYCYGIYNPEDFIDISNEIERLRTEKVRQC